MGLRDADVPVGTDPEDIADRRGVVPEGGEIGLVGGSKVGVVVVDVVVDAIDLEVVIALELEAFPVLLPPDCRLEGILLDRRGWPGPRFVRSQLIAPAFGTAAP